MRQYSPLAFRSRRKTAGLILTLAYLVCLGFLAAYGHHQLALHQEQRLTRAAELSRVLADHAERTLSEADRTLQIAALLLHDGEGDRPSADLIRTILKELAEDVAPIRYLVILDESGRSVGDAGAALPQFSDASEESYFRRHREGESGLIITRPARTQDGRWFFALSRALVDQENNFRGVAVAAIDLHYLERFVARLQYGSEDRLALIGRQGIVYYASGMDDRDVGRLLPHWNPGAEGLIRKEALLGDALADAIIQPLAHYPLEALVAVTPLTSAAQAVDVAKQIAPVAAITLLLVPGIALLLLFHRNRAERLLHDIAETMPGVLYRLRIDEDGTAKVLWVGQRASKILGLDDVTALSADPRKFRLHPADEPRCRAALLQAGRTNRDLTLEARRILPDGTTKHFRATGRPRPDNEGWVFNGVIFDITEERRAADSVRTSEKRLAMVLDAAQDAIIALDCSLKITHFNKGAEMMFGLSTAEVIGQPVDLVLPPRGQDFREIMERALQGPDGARDMGDWRELRAMRGNGAEFPLLSSISKVTLPNGEAMLCCIMRDMTDLAESERQLRQLTTEQGRLLALAEEANHAKARFLATMSHELRTPLNAIIGFSEAMEAQIFGPITSERYRGYIHDILRSGRHLLELINDILDLSKIQQSGMEFRLGNLDARDAVTDALIFVYRRATEKGVEIKIVEENAGTVVADERALRQILINLLGNALKFTPEGGAITVTLRARPGAFLAIQVDDTGPGVSADLLPRLGDPFVQDRDIYTGSGTGTGLGLAIVRELVAAHQGRLTFANRPEGGFRAIVELPMARETLPAGDAGPATHSQLQVL